VQRILIAVDGSKASERAVRHLIRLRAGGMALRALVLNVQPEWAPSRSAAEEKEGRRLHALAAQRATRRARSLLTAAQIPFDERMQVGDAAEHIVRLARARRCSQIVMGMRGLGAVARIVLGSVSMKVLRLANVPVTLVK
jgi:nucleotide-binding universal stress UspA family protein